jgi:hypothetical protein
MTPEGRVKKDIRAYLDSLGTDCRYFMPQNMGMGESGVSDFIGVYKGKGFAFEAKAPGAAKLTPWQLRFLDSWNAAGGYASVVRSAADVRQWLEGWVP